MMATDLHLGHLENDPIRGDDSFIAFEEILQNAKDHKVDMIILGGDLFHINKPSRRTIWKTMKLLRTYCVGQGDIKFKIVSDQGQNFPNRFASLSFPHIPQIPPSQIPLFFLLTQFRGQSELRR
jgi:double-strand break repair protein MRE11